MTVRIRDRGAAKLVALSGSKAIIKVGIIGNDASAPKRGRGSSVGETLVGVASVHEFGAGVHERSFIRGYADENESINRSRLNGAIRSVISGRTSLNNAMELLGLTIVGEIQARISNRIPPQLSDKTIKRKGSDVPLIDTGQLRSSITHEVKTHRARTHG